MAMKLPSMQFYPGDWLKDASLRACSPAARGVWIDLICLSFECETRGVFRSKNGSKTRAFSIKKLSEMCAGAKPKLIQELIDNGVLKVANRTGTLYVKRVFIDELRRRRKARNGGKGGKQNGSKTEANSKQKGGSSSSASASTSSSNKPDTGTGGRCLKISGGKDGKRSGPPGTLSAITPELLRSSEHLDAWFRDAVKQGSPPGGLKRCEADRQLVFQAACHALREGDNPSAMFVSIIKGQRNLIESLDEDQARERLRKLDGQSRASPVVNLTMNSVDDKPSRQRDAADQIIREASNASP